MHCGEAAQLSAANVRSSARSEYNPEPPARRSGVANVSSEIYTNLLGLPSLVSTLSSKGPDRRCSAQMRMVRSHNCTC